jgi:hypothetical protein
MKQLVLDVKERRGLTVAVPILFIPYPYRVQRGRNEHQQGPLRLGVAF